MTPPSRGAKRRSVKSAKIAATPSPAADLEARKVAEAARWRRHHLAELMPIFGDREFPYDDDEMMTLVVIADSWRRARMEKVSSCVADGRGEPSVVVETSDGRLDITCLLLREEKKLNRRTTLVELLAPRFRVGDSLRTLVTTWSDGKSTLEYLDSYHWFPWELPPKSTGFAKKGWISLDFLPTSERERKALLAVGCAPRSRHERVWAAPDQDAVFEAMDARKAAYENDQGDRRRATANDKKAPLGPAAEQVTEAKSNSGTVKLGSAIPEIASRNPKWKTEPPLFQPELLRPIADESTWKITVAAGAIDLSHHVDRKSVKRTGTRVREAITPPAVAEPRLTPEPAKENALAEAASAPPETPRRGRPPKGEVPMSKAERNRRWRANKNLVSLEIPEGLIERLRSAREAAGIKMADLLVAALDALERKVGQ